MYYSTFRMADALLTQKLAKDFTAYVVVIPQTDFAYQCDVNTITLHATFFNKQEYVVVCHVADWEQGKLVILHNECMIYEEMLRCIDQPQSYGFITETGHCGFADS